MGIFNIFKKKEDACTILTPVEGVQAKRYTCFREILKNNYTALHGIADIEAAYHSGKPFTLEWVRIKCREIFLAVSQIISSFEDMSGKDMPSLSKARDAIKHSIEEELKAEFEFLTQDRVLPLEKIISSEMKRMTGNKAGNLALIRNHLNMPVPDGFSITAYAFKTFMDENRLTEVIADAMEELAVDSGGKTDALSKKIQEMILIAEIPQSLAKEMMEAYAKIEKQFGAEVHMAVRSSAIREDTEASFAGQYSTELNVTKSNLLNAYKKVIAGKYSPRALSYRMHHGLGDQETPMCAAVIVMLDPSASGVMYTRNPAEPGADVLKVNAVSGLGEYLVDGSGSPDIFMVDREHPVIVESHISNKEFRMVNLKDGGIDLEAMPESERQTPAIDEKTVFQLREYGLKLEAYFGSPQDVEWAVDKKGKLYILQSRPLNIISTYAKEAEIAVDETEHPVLVSGGKTASSGVAMGKVFVIGPETRLADIPQNAIVIAKTAAARFAEVIGRAKGIITDMGGITSHLASVAREFEIPMLVDLKTATSVLKDGDTVTLYADAKKVFSGLVPALEAQIKRVKRTMFESPVYQKTRKVLDQISPLHLTDPKSPLFKPESCKSIHDIVRFTHELSMKKMFDFGESAGKRGMTSVKLNANLPMQFYLIDVGGGLKFGLSDCDAIDVESVTSIPFKAVWKGFTHPGITWSGGMNVNMGDLFTLMAGGATQQMPGTAPSYVLIAQDYMNMSARFGYHFATIDTLCSEKVNQNYITLQFSGGVGTYDRRSMRVVFLGKVLKQLGFDVTLKGDLLDASLRRYDRTSSEEKLDQMARLLACSRLLDMAISSQEQITEMTESFFRQEYHLLEKKQEGEPEGMYIHTGQWTTAEVDNSKICIQDGSQWGNAVTSGFTSFMGRIFGSSYQEFLDNIGAYHYFPLAVAKDSEIENGSASVRIKADAGTIDRAGGLAFGIRDVCNYFVFRINAIENNVALFEFDKAKRYLRGTIKKNIDTGQWYQVRVDIEGTKIKAYVENEMVLGYDAQKPVTGFIGLWTKADSTSSFDNFLIQSRKKLFRVEF